MPPSVATRERPVAEPSAAPRSPAARPGEDAAPWLVPDELWERIEPMLPSAQRRMGRRRLPDRHALDGILYVLCTGHGLAAAPARARLRLRIHVLAPARRVAARGVGRAAGAARREPPGRRSLRVVARQPALRRRRSSATSDRAARAAARSGASHRERRIAPVPQDEGARQSGRRDFRLGHGLLRLSQAAGVGFEPTGGVEASTVQDH